MRRNHGEHVIDEVAVQTGLAGQQAQQDLGQHLHPVGVPWKIQPKRTYNSNYVPAYRGWSSNVECQCVTFSAI